MKIPTNANELIEEIIGKAQSLIWGVKAGHTWIERGQTPPQLEELCDDVDSFWRELNLFPYRWAKFDPCEWAFYMRAKGARFFFSFFIPAIPDPMPPGEQLVEIPYELYRAYDELKDPTEGLDNKDWHYVVEGSKLCTQVIRSSKSLKRFIKIREECLNEYQMEQETPAKKSIADAKSLKPAIIDNGRLLQCAKGTFDFQKRQAPLIEIYFNNYLDGNDYLSEQSALELADMIMKERYPNQDFGYSDSNFNSLFRSKRENFKAIFDKHPDQKDMFRLDLW